MIVTWVSSLDEDGWVEWALSAGDLAGRTATFAIANDQRGDLSERINRKTHRVPIPGLLGEAAVYFNVVSGGSVDPRGPYEVAVPSAPLITPPAAIAGRVTFSDGTLGSECLVYIRVEFLLFGQPLMSLWINTMTDGGAYVEDITNIRREDDINRSLIYSTNSENATIHVKAKCGHGRRRMRKSRLSWGRWQPT